MTEQNSRAKERAGQSPHAHLPLQPPSLVASSVIIALAESEGVDLTSLILPFRRRARSPEESLGRNGLRLLSWPASSSGGFTGPEAARRFFENFELFPGMVVRDWDHPQGRLGFSLDADRVTFELHVPSAGLLISGTPDTVKIAVRDALPETLCVGLVGQPLDRLVAWPPACGPGYLVVSVEAEDDGQIVTLTTTPVRVDVG